MQGYGQYCPVALGAEVFAERWTPIILRNVLIGCRRFGEILDGAPGLPRGVLVRRLRRLELAGVLSCDRSGHFPVYSLTDAGRELCEVCLALGAWAARWREASEEQVDPYLMLWMLARLIDPTTLPRPRVVVRFDLTDGSRPNRYWLLASRTGNEVCAQHPGFQEHGVVTTDARVLLQWHTGQLSLGRAERAGLMVVQGARWLERELAAWGRLSPFAGIRPAAGQVPTGGP